MPKLVSQSDVAGVLQHVLPRSWMYEIARLHGRLIWALKRDRRKAVARNLAPYAADARELRTMTRRFFELRQLRVLMLVMFLSMDPDEWEQHLTFDGLENLDLALRDGKGAILLGSHLNSIGGFMAIMILRQRGYDVRVALPSDVELFEPTTVGRFLRRGSPQTTLTEHLGGFFVQFNVRPIVRKLAENAIIGQTGDGWHSVAFARVPFLGRSLPFTTGMMSVAQSTGASVVPFNIVGEAPALRCSIAGPFVVPHGDHPDQELTDAVASYAQALERELLKNPICWEHWLIDDTLNKIESWTERSLQERFEV